MNSEHQKHESGDLDWLAFCYIADELEPMAKAEFEQRLEHDQAARDAIVDAMTLAAAIHQSQTDPVAQLTSQPTVPLDSASRRQWVAAPRFVFAASVTLALVTAAWFWLTVESSKRFAAENELAIAWVTVADLTDSDGPESPANSLEIELWEADESPDEFDERTLPRVDSDEDDVDEGSTDWLVLALEDLGSLEDAE